MTDNPQKIKIIVVDDHTMFRIGLKATFHIHHPTIEIVGEADSSDSLFKILPNSTADIVLLDINLPDIGGVEIARRLRNEYPDIKILAFSAENTSETIQAILNVGVDGFVSKQKGNVEKLTEAIQSVMSGVEYFGQDISAIIYDIYVAKKKSAIISTDFTEREKEIIILCRNGYLCKEIAISLGISVHTVNTHKKNIFQKLGINNTREMVHYALRNGIIRVE